MATILAKTTRDLFGCQTWVADYKAPADTDTIARNEEWDRRIEARARLEDGRTTGAVSR